MTDFPLNDAFTRAAEFTRRYELAWPRLQAPQIALPSKRAMIALACVGTLVSAACAIGWVTAPVGRENCIEGSYTHPCPHKY